MPWVFQKSVFLINQAVILQLIRGRIVSVLGDKNGQLNVFTIFIPFHKYKFLLFHEQNLLKRFSNYGFLHCFIFKLINCGIIVCLGSFSLGDKPNSTLILRTETN